MAIIFNMAAYNISARPAWVAISVKMLILIIIGHSYLEDCGIDSNYQLDSFHQYLIIGL